MKYALIGCGRISTNHIKAALNNQLQIAAVCDILPEAMENLLAKHGLETESSITRYTDYVTMLDEVRPELVSIAAVPPSSAAIFAATASQVGLASRE